MKKCVMGVVFIFIAVGCKTTSPYHRQLKIDWNEATRTKNYETIIKRAKEWREKEPSNPESYFWLGRGYSASGKYVQGALNFKKGLNILPEEKYKEYLSEFKELSITFFNAGVLYNQRDSVDKAIPMFHTSFELDSSNVKALVYEASLLQAKGEKEKASRVLELAYRINPEEPDVVYFNALFKKDSEPGISIEMLKKLVKIEKDNPRGYGLLGQIYLSEDKPDSALIYLKKAYQMDTTNVDYLSGYAFSLLKTEKYKESIYYFEKLTKERPEEPRAFALLGAAYDEVNDNHKALEAYDKALALDPDNSDYLQAKAATLIELGRKQEAYKILLKVEKLKKKNGTP